MIIKQSYYCWRPVKDVRHEVDARPRGCAITFILKTSVALREDVGEGAVQA